MRRLWIARLVLAALLPVLPGAARAQDAPVHATPALWRVQNRASTVYLFGSFHILPRGYAWTTPAIAAAMEAADSFVFEVPIGDDALKDEEDFVIRNGFLRGRQTLRGFLSPLEYDTYSGVLQRTGLKPEQFLRFRPWLASLMLGLGYLHGSDLFSLTGADETIMKYATGRGKPLQYLETPEQQLDLLAAGDDGEQLRALKRLISMLSKSRAEQEELFESWAEGAPEKLQSLFEKYLRDNPEAEHSLVDNRNRAWMGTLERLLASPGISMVTVGAAHIGGEHGLLALLCRDGYEVDRVANAGASGATICSAR